MAKVRVYELAKDLNMTNRALLNKMKELKIDVKSHMSSLEDSAVSTIKRSLLGKNKKKGARGTGPGRCGQAQKGKKEDQG